MLGAQKMTAARRVTVALLAAFVVAGAATADDHYRPPQYTQAYSSFTLSAWFVGLTPGTRYEASFTGHFEDGDYYEYGGFTRDVRPNGVILVETDVADLVYYDPGKPLEWVRVCLHVPGTTNTEITGPDGMPLCTNVETGDYHTEDYEYEEESWTTESTKRLKHSLRTSAPRR